MIFFIKSRPILFHINNTSVIRPAKQNQFLQYFFFVLFFLFASGVTLNFKLEECDMYVILLCDCMLLYVCMFFLFCYFVHYKCVSVFSIWKSLQVLQKLASRYSHCLRQHKELVWLLFSSATKTTDHYSIYLSQIYFT